MKLKPLGYGLTCYLFFSFSCHQYFRSTLDVMFFTGHDLGLYSLFVFTWYMGYFLLACIITHALSVTTQMSAISCLCESYKHFWDIWLWFSFNLHENQISVNKKCRFLGKPESWKSSASELNWPRARSCPWISDQGNQTSWSLFLEVLGWAKQQSSRQCLGPECETGWDSARWDSAGWDRTRAVHMMDRAILFNFSEGEEW